LIPPSTWEHGGPKNKLHPVSLHPTKPCLSSKNMLHEIDCNTALSIDRYSTSFSPLYEKSWWALNFLDSCHSGRGAPWDCIDRYLESFCAKADTLLLQFSGARNADNEHWWRLAGSLRLKKRHEPFKCSPQHGQSHARKTERGCAAALSARPESEV